MKNQKGDRGERGEKGKQGIQGIRGKTGITRVTGDLKLFVDFGQKIKEQLVLMMLFAIMFSTVGYFIPKIYFRYFDKTIYYEVQLPIKVKNKIYHPCEFVDVYVIRRSLITVSTRAMIELRLYSEDDKGTKILVDKQFRELAILKSENNQFNTVISHWLLPCGISAGRYVFEGVVPHRVNGEDKVTILKTEDFIVESTNSATIK